MTSLPPRSRTREEIEREYGREKWPAIERLIEAATDAEPEAGLSRILGRIARSQWQGADPLAERDFTIAGERGRLPLSGAYGAAQGVQLELVRDAIRPDTDLIVELGSGWAWHLLTLWATGGPAEATYIAAEYTAAGRRSAERLAALDEQLPFRAVAFDYHEPAFDVEPARHAVVFSAHSIEQIPQVRPELFAALRGLAGEVTAVHFEPVGWQIDGHDGRGSSGAYAAEHDYNRNLVEAVKTEVAAGRVALERLAPDVFGVNPVNSTTVVRWRSVGR